MPSEPPVSEKHGRKIRIGSCAAVDILLAICGLLLVLNDLGNRRTLPSLPTINLTALGSPAVRTALAGTFDAMSRERPALQSTAAAPIIHLEPTPTEFRLPFNDKNVESHYCQGHGDMLAAREGQGLSDDEIVRRVMGRWLAYFQAPKAPDWCRIAGYSIDEVYYNASALAPPVEPQGDIMRVVRFSVKLVQVPNAWMSFAGEVDQRNWLHTAEAVAVFRSVNGYTMQFATP